MVAGLGRADGGACLRRPAKPAKDFLAWGDSLDTKLVGVFAVGAIILTLAPALQPPSTNLAVVCCWIVAGLLWLVALAFGVHGYRPKVFRIGPHPQVLLDRKWLAKSPLEFGFGRLP